MFEAPARARREAIAAQVEFARVQQIYERTPEPLLSSAGFAVLVAWALFSFNADPMALVWCAAKQLTFLLRWLDCRSFQQQTPLRPEAARWRRRHAIGSGLDAVGWGLIPLMCVPTGSPMLDGAVVAGLVGVASVGVFALNSFASHALRFMLGCLLPMMGYQVWLGGPAMPIVTIGLFVYFAVFWREAERHQARWLELLRLRFENVAISEEREQALLLAQHSNAAKSRFLATVSHELRTPLNGILGVTQLLANDGLTPRQTERLKVMQHSARHLQTLLADLLDTSRADVGRLTLAPQAVLLDGLIDEVTDLLAPVAHEKGLDFQVSKGADLPAAALLDGPRIKQVLHNLIGNALKFTEHGTVSLRVAVRPGPTELLCFEVEDSGPGVPQALRKRIFDPFDQGALDADARRSGTGLGLTIVRQLAQVMGGDVVCDGSALGGARFCFSAPLHRAAPPAPPEPAHPSSSPLTGMVLVVEDNPVNLMVCGAMLEHLGLRWCQAVDGQAALDRMAEGKLDLVLMDCQMPVLDGLSAARRWRAHEQAQQLPRLPIIALTANNLTGDQAQCLAAGMDAFLFKPFEQSALQSLLTQYLTAPNRVGVPAADNPTA
ncbi:ATP-binding protein [Ideonella sp.]|uniref:ATP-binding protein n=1 Tax=Ideonella sp. TaxID=1929293 RepID=UPI003BB741B6